VGSSGVLRGWIERCGGGAACALHGLEERVCSAAQSAGAAARRSGADAVRTHCAKLGIRIIAASSPQAKGRVERAHGTHQDRLVKKLRLAGIVNCDQAQRISGRAISRPAQPPLHASGCAGSRLVLNFPTGALAHLQIGRAYAIQGDRNKARAAPASCAFATSASSPNRRRATLLPLCFQLLRGSDNTPAAEAWSSTNQPCSLWNCPSSQSVVKDAQQELASSEIYDFEYTPRGPGWLRLEVANGGLNSKVVQPIEVQ
jgi:hypothetical protein